ncbi:hypothetical protein TNCT_143301 [Trichonephila clavata]|uniref:Uncharacterized protein n=1 Tax=Trichonephila clavata TaxID=2740835 RepID=A0A8X6HPV1_TRICU|nr:hypothetical protein TNCT_143301 [Trichonephila clavata]
MDIVLRLHTKSLFSGTGVDRGLRQNWIFQEYSELSGDRFGFKAKSPDVDVTLINHLKGMRGTAINETLNRCRVISKPKYHSEKFEGPEKTNKNNLYMVYFVKNFDDTLSVCQLDVRKPH